MLFLASAFYLGWIIYWSLIKKNVPLWVQRLYGIGDRQKTNGRSKQASTAVKAFQAGLMILVYVALYGVSRSFFPNPVWVLGIATLSFVGLIRLVRKNFLPAVQAHSEKQNIAQSEIKEAPASTDWATREQIQNAIPYAANDGVPVGIHIGEGFHWYDKGHMLTVGSFRQGKDVALILPALLSEGLVAGGLSFVCLDQNGEYAAIAAPHLTQIGYDVHVLNPFNIPEIANFGSSRFNPLNHIDPASHDASEYYNVLAMALYNHKGSSEDGFFDDRCRQYISLYLSFANRLKMTSFYAVYEWLTRSDQKRETILEVMAEFKAFTGADTASAIIARLKGEEAAQEKRIFDAIEPALTILADEQIRDSLTMSDFTVQDMAGKPTAIFICVPLDDTPRCAPWIRMILSYMLRVLTKRHDLRRKVVVMLDEVVQLAYVDEIVCSWTTLIYRNVTLWLVAQNYGHLQTTYGDPYEMFVSGSKVKHWFNMENDKLTADYIAQRMPQAVSVIGPDCNDVPKETDLEGLEFNHYVGFTQMICEIDDLELPVKFDKVPYWRLPFSRNNASSKPFK